MPRSYLIRTYGCQMNVHDSERVAGILETMGYRPAADEAGADLILLNTCAVRENADNKLYGKLGWLKQTKEERQAEGGDLTIAVGGCLAQKDGAAIVERAPWVDVVYGTHNLAHLPDLLQRADSQSIPVVELIEAIETFPSAMPAKREVRHHAWVAISVGCDNACTFCIVPTLRGPERSRRVGDIVTEVTGLVADGVLEVTLLGQNVNSYGRDLDGRSHFAELLRELGGVAGLERVRFTSPHPRDFTEDVLHAMAETPNACEHLHLPLQSGSDRILRAMRRSYRQQRYLDLVARTRELLPDATLTTDIIVGFPGETDEDFAATLDVVAQVGFDQAYTFQYSPRPGTPAAAMTEQFVPADVVAERYAALADLVRRQSDASYGRLVGTAAELLLESPSKTDPQMLSGRTRGSHLVHLPAGSGYAPGDLVHAEVLRATPNYAIAAAPHEVRRTPAGEATEVAMQATGEWRLTGGAPTPGDPHAVTGAGRRALPVVV